MINNTNVLVNYRKCDFQQFTEFGDTENEEFVVVIGFTS